MPDSALLFCSFVLGLCFGSFLNVCIYRLPQGLSVVSPGSYCPLCRHPIAFYDNLPVASYIFLGGRCRYCRGLISLRYPIVEILAAGLTAGLVCRWQGEWPWAAAAVLSALALVAVAFIDGRTFLIPDELSLGVLGLGILSSWFNPYLGGGWSGVLCSVLGAAGGWAVGLCMAAAGERIFKKEALGGGDVKLLAAIGALTSWEGVFSSLLIASLLGSAYGISLLLAGKIRRRDPIPFGPFLSAGAVANLFYLVKLRMFLGV